MKLRECALGGRGLEVKGVRGDDGHQVALHLEDGGAGLGGPGSDDAVYRAVDSRLPEKLVLVANVRASLVRRGARPADGRLRLCDGGLGAADLVLIPVRLRQGSLRGVEGRLGLPDLLLGGLDVLAADLAAGLVRLGVAEGGLGLAD